MSDSESLLNMFRGLPGVDFEPNYFFVRTSKRWTRRRRRRRRRLTKVRMKIVIDFHVLLCFVT